MELCRWKEPIPGVVGMQVTDALPHDWNTPRKSWEEHTHELLAWGHEDAGFTRVGYWAVVHKVDGEVIDGETLRFPSRKEALDWYRHVSS